MYFSTKNLITFLIKTSTFLNIKNKITYGIKNLTTLPKISIKYLISITIHEIK